MTIASHPELQQVLKGLALNRQPGWNYPGNFLEVSFDEVLMDSARLSLTPGPHCVNADGQVNIGAVSLLADIGMAVTLRRHIGMPTRMATVSMSLQFTGAPITGRLESRGRLDGFFKDAAAPQGMTRCEIYADDTLVCTASGSFVVLGNREGIAALPMRQRGVDADVAPLALNELTQEEAAVYARAENALQARAQHTQGPLSFIENFWGFLPQRVEGKGASCTFDNGLHVGNRVGHTQGGITFGLAASTANGALGDDWRLGGVAAWYLNPGTGPKLQADAEIVHQGGLTAVVNTRITDERGRIVLEVVSNHVRVTG